MRSPRSIRNILALAATAALLLPATATHTAVDPPASYRALREEAEGFYAEKSYTRALDLYRKASDLELPPAEKRWVAFRMADVQWRARAASATADPTVDEQAIRELNALAPEESRATERDRVWSEVQESLGDYRWTRRGSSDWYQAWPFYQRALEWWAGSADVAMARGRFLRIVHVAADPPWKEPDYRYGSYGNNLPLETLEQALLIAGSAAERAYLHYLIAITLRSGWNGDPSRHRRIASEFRQALEAGRAAAWYDDTLFANAQWLESGGRFTRLPGGQSRIEPDYPGALELYRRLLREFGKGETRYWDQAAGRVEAIMRPEVGVQVSEVFLPGSEIRFNLTWRNVASLHLSLTRVDLTRDLNIPAAAGDFSWLQHLDVSRAPRQRSWSRETGDRGDHVPGQEMVRLEGKLAPGAYALDVEGGESRARELILVSDATLLVQAAGKKRLLYFADSRDGSPLAGAAVRLWETAYDRNGRQTSREFAGITDADGLALYAPVDERVRGGNVFATAALGDRQAFAMAGDYRSNVPAGSWRVWAFTDRPAYRPGEEVRWKAVARVTGSDGYQTPSGVTIGYRIADPRGAEVKKGDFLLNSYGSGWDSLTLTEAMTLGEYRISFRDQANHDLGSATLFRLEEYKLPEFKVTVELPMENGRRKVYRPGETMEAVVTAQYYSGGPVADARVEAVIFQKPFTRRWRSARDFPWLYQQTEGDESGWPGTEMQRLSLRTDAGGRATVTIEVPASSTQDLEYRIEARITDASRREVSGSGLVRVSRQAYEVRLEPEHALYHPQDTVAIRIEAKDANDQPVKASGKVTITRDVWEEAWRDPRGKEYRGDELRALRVRGRVFPPPPEAGCLPWTLAFQGWRSEPVQSHSITTDESGEARLTFVPGREGYYRVAWLSEPDDEQPVTGATMVWAATAASIELGYRYGGLQIVLDKDTVRAGQTVPAMILAPNGGRFALIMEEGDDLLNHRLVRFDGQVKLVEVTVGRGHVPNFFLTAAMILDNQLHLDTQEVVVPPEEHFLEVRVTPDRPERRPGEEGTLTVTTRDERGQPVSAEVALGLVDESVLAIQEEYAPDPRRFFFGEKRHAVTPPQSTFNRRPYVRLTAAADGTLRPEGEWKDGRVDERKRKGEGGYALDALAVGASAVGGEKLRGEPMAAKMEFAKSIEQAPPPSTPAGTAEPAVRVRHDFSATAYWRPDLVTGADGTAVVTVRYPDSLTRWKAAARAVTMGSQVGLGETAVRVRLPLMVRLQAPRFFTVGDTVTVSAVIDNTSDAPLKVSPGLESQGLTLHALGDGGEVLRRQPSPVEVPAGGQKRVDWTVSADQAGQARLKVTARAGDLADAMEKSYPVYEHGVAKTISRSGTLRGDRLVVRLALPRERRPESTVLTIQAAPSLAVTMLDALPYLADYPYGCTEQTMSRFLPAVITARTLKDLGLPPQAVAGKIFGGIEREFADRTHPRGAGDLSRLDDMVAAGLQRLYDFQHADGGWGWWKLGDDDPFMTAYVLWGLALARQAGVPVHPDVADLAASWLVKELVSAEGEFDLQAWMLHALAAHRAVTGRGRGADLEAKALENLWNNRQRLNAYTRALLALAAEAYGQHDRALVLLRNLEDGVKKDQTPDASVVEEGTPDKTSVAEGTAHWGEDGIVWRWSEGGVEATATALRAMLAIDPRHPLVGPVTTWLIRNRRGAQWSNTRDTAMVVLALDAYLKQSGELQGEMAYGIEVNGHPLVEKRIATGEGLTAPSSFEVYRRYVRDGENEIRVRRLAGSGPLYVSVRADFFSLEEPITPAGSALFVRREYFRLAGRPTLLKGIRYEREPLDDGGTVSSGERVESVITIEGKNNYEYLVFEDLKPAGLEAVEMRSGEPLRARELRAEAVRRRFGGGQATTPERAPEHGAKPGEKTMRAPQPAPPQGEEEESGEADYTGRTRYVYQELRDRTVSLFIDKLPEGVWEIRYPLRAEVPGQFHALPVLGHAMYVPEIRANGSEARLTVTDR